MPLVKLERCGLGDEGLVAVAEALCAPRGDPNDRNEKNFGAGNRKEMLVATALLLQGKAIGFTLGGYHTVLQCTCCFLL